MFLVFQIGAFAAALALLAFGRQSRELLGTRLHEVVAVTLACGALVARTTKPLLYAGTDLAAGTYFYGWAVGSACGLWVYARFRGLCAGRMFDALAPAVLLGVAIGRLGCAAAGCCGGVLPLTVLGVTIHPPLQLLSAAAAAVAALATQCIVRPRVERVGGVAVWALWLFSALRFPLECWRAEPAVFGGLTQGQGLGLVLSSLGLLIYPLLRPAACSGAPSAGR